GASVLIDGPCMFVLKLKSDGQFVWAKTIQNDNGWVSLAESLDAVAMSQDGHLHITGQFTGTVDFDPDRSNQVLTSNAGRNNFEDVFVLKLDSMGKFVWVKSLSGTGRLYGTSIAVD